MFDHHGEISDQEVRGAEDDKFVFPPSTLHNSGQCILRQQQILTSTSNQLMFPFRPGSSPVLLMVSARMLLSRSNLLKIAELSAVEGAINTVA